MSNRLGYIIITALFLVIIFNIWQCDRNSSGSGKDSTNSEIVKSTSIINNYYDTTINKINVDVHPPVVSIENPIPADVDTMAILRRYYTDFIYIDTIQDSSLTVFLRDTIGENKIKGRGFNYKINRPTLIQTITNNTIAEKKIQVYGGLTGGYTPLAKYPSICPSAMLTDKKGNAYTVDIDFLNKGGKVGLYKIISFKKKSK